MEYGGIVEKLMKTIIKSKIHKRIRKDLQILVVGLFHYIVYG